MRTGNTPQPEKLSLVSFPFSPSWRGVDFTMRLYMFNVSQDRQMSGSLKCHLQSDSSWKNIFARIKVIPLKTALMIKPSMPKQERFYPALLSATVWGLYFPFYIRSPPWHICRTCPRFLERDPILQVLLSNLLSITGRSLFWTNRSPELDKRSRRRLELSLLMKVDERRSSHHPILVGCNLLVRGFF